MGPNTSSDPSLDFGGVGEHLPLPVYNGYCPSPNERKELEKVVEPLKAQGGDKDTRGGTITHPYRDSHNRHRLSHNPAHLKATYLKFPSGHDLLEPGTILQRDGSPGGWRDSSGNDPAIGSEGKQVLDPWRSRHYLMEEFSHPFHLAPLDRRVPGQGAQKRRHLIQENLHLAGPLPTCKG